MNPFRKFLGAVDSVERRMFPVRTTVLIVGLVTTAMFGWWTFVWYKRLPPAPPTPERTCHDVFEFRRVSDGAFVCSHSQHRVVVERVNVGIADVVADVRCVCTRPPADTSSAAPGSPGLP